MKYVLCPPCGAVFESESEEDLVRLTQLHAKEKHDYTPPREEIMEYISSEPPNAG